MKAQKRIVIVLVALLLTLCQPVTYAAQDIVLHRIYEAALDLPRIYFTLKRTPESPALGADSDTTNYAFLDTGASGLLLSRETADTLGISLDPKAQFADVGIGGTELFSVSEPLYLGLAGFNANPSDSSTYKFIGPGRFQVKKAAAGILSEPLDIIGMPAMIGRIAVLHSAATNSLEYFTADIKEPTDRDIPKVDFKVALNFKKFTHLSDPNNIPPLPTLAYNPVIKGLTINRGSKSSRGDWLLDTGATISLISTKQAAALGLMDQNGTPLASQAFSLPVGGIGNMVQVPGFEIDSLTIQTITGQNLIFKNVRLGVHDIRYFDEEKGKLITIDGVFGSNFLCASAKMESLFPSEVSETMFEYIVIDMKKGTLGFDLLDNNKNRN